MEDSVHIKPQRVIKKFPRHQVQAMGREFLAGATLREVSRQWQVSYRTLLTFKQKGFFLGQEDQSVNVHKEEPNPPDFDESQSFFSRYEVRDILRILDQIEKIFMEVDTKIRAGTCSKDEFAARVDTMYCWIDLCYRSHLEICAEFAREYKLSDPSAAMPQVLKDRIRRFRSLYREIEKRFKCASASSSSVQETLESCA